jgi:hypothetical protein
MIEEEIELFPETRWLIQDREVDGRLCRAHTEIQRCHCSLQWEHKAPELIKAK